MKNGFLKAALVATFGVSLSAFAFQTTAEKAKETGRTTKLNAKKKLHRGEEKLCAKGDASCAKDKVSNRATEAKDAVKAKASTTKEKLD